MMLWQIDLLVVYSYKDISYKMDHQNHTIMCLSLLHEVLTNLKYHVDEGKQTAQPKMGLFVHTLISEVSKGQF